MFNINCSDPEKKRARHLSRKLDESSEERGQKSRWAIWRGLAEAIAEVELRRPKGRARPTRVEERRKTADADQAHEP